MDKKLQSNFSKVRAIIVLSVNKERDWRLNSTTAARDSYKTNIWEDNYYVGSCNEPLLFEFPKEIENVGSSTFNRTIFPNPAYHSLFISKLPEEYLTYSLLDISGIEFYRKDNSSDNELIFPETMKPGIYILRVFTNESVLNYKIIKE